jgi:PAS domain S-box-containing protein
MKSQILGKRSISDSMVLAVVLIATVYWVLDSILNIFFSNQYNLVAQLVGPDLYDIYIRAVVLCLLVILGSHAQSIINRLNEARERLNQSEELWRSLVETAPDTIMTVDHAGVIRFINQSLMGVPAQQATGRRLYDLLPEEDRAPAEEIVQRVLRTGEVEAFEIRAGKPLLPSWHSFRVGPLRLNRRVVAATIISTDTTEFKRAEELIRYKELFENVGDGVFLLNSIGRIIEPNDRLIEKTGFGREELVAHPLSTLIPPFQAGVVDRMIAQTGPEAETRWEIDLKAKDGRMIACDVSCRRVMYAGMPCFLCVARDITRTRLLHQQLIRSERLAATGQLAASIAHEINSPLQGISALLNVMRSRYEDDPYLTRKLDLVKSAFNSIRDTVKNLIDLNRPGKEKKQPADVNQVVENTMALVRSLLKKNIISAQLELAALPSTLFASPQQLAQVLMNLVNNSVEAITGAPGYYEKAHLSENNGGRITVRTMNRGDEIVLELCDNGPGIPEEDLERIFDPFFTSKKPMGMGVGLSICHGIIEEHRGRISAANAPEGGAVFTIALPARQEAEAA